MQINPINRNHTQFLARSFRSLPVMSGVGPFIEEYLDALHTVIRNSLADNRRVCALRFDLHYPRRADASIESTSNEIISRFIDSLKAKINHDRSRAKARQPYAHDTSVRYVWAREVGGGNRVHYHFAILVNRDAYFTLGRYDSKEKNMAQRIKEAWVSALGMPIPSEEMEGLVHFPDNAVYRFELDSMRGVQDFFHRASYLCKSRTKQFGNGQHGFGASRK